jgi:hypothetical protein
MISLIITKGFRIIPSDVIERMTVATLGFFTAFALTREKLNTTPSEKIMVSSIYCFAEK